MTCLREAESKLKEWEEDRFFQPIPAVAHPLMAHSFLQASPAITLGIISSVAYFIAKSHAPMIQVPPKSHETLEGHLDINYNTTEYEHLLQHHKVEKS